MKNYKYTVGILLIVLLLGCESQSVEVEKYGSINGLILNGETYEPLAGVQVATNPATSSVITDSSGSFTFTKVLEGDVAITAHKNDFLSNSISVAVYENDPTYLTFYLMKDDNDVGWIQIFDPVPGNGAVDQRSSMTMQWDVDQQYSSKILEYTVYYFTSNSTTQLIAGEGLTSKSVVVNGLEFSTVYYWYVVAKHEGERVANSPTWSFKTGEDDY